MFVNFFSENGAIYDVIWKNIAEPNRPLMTLWRMRIPCWIPKAANTHCWKGQYLMLFNYNVGARTRLTVTFFIRFLSFNFILVLDFLFYFWKLGGSVRTIKENADALVVASKVTGLEVNVDKTKYIVLSRDQNARRSHSMKSDNSSFERVEEFKYLGTTLTNQSSIQEEIQSRLKSGNACCHSAQNLLSSSLLSKNLKIKIYRTIILLVVLYGCETWSLTLREELRLKLFENRVLRRIFGPKRDEVTRKWRNLHNEELNDLYSSPSIVGVIKSRRMRWAGRVARTGRGEVFTGF